jgi:mannose-6-phosphate isomerase-like protein (cupin superfamily)
VLPVGHRYFSVQTGAWVQIVERSDRWMKFERSWKPNSGRGEPHYHEDFTQTWDAITGAGFVEVDGERRPFLAGDRVVLEAGRPHRDPFTEEGELTIRGTFTPCPPFIEDYASALVHHMENGTVNSQDDIPILQILLVARHADGRSYRSGIPKSLQTATLPLVAGLARLRGMRPSYE